MKQITIEQLNTLLQVLYSTNVPAAQFDAVKKMLLELKDIEVKEETKKK